MKKKSFLIVTIFLVLILVIGATFAYWQWNSNNLVTINITTNMGGIGLTFNGGTTSVSGLAPAKCTHSTYANTIPVTISRYNETEYLATTNLTLTLTSFTWVHSKPSVTDLSNIKFAVTNSNSSCINPIASGDLATGVMNNTASTAESQNTKIMDWEYILPANSGTQGTPINETYYLYVWIDPDYTFTNDGSNQIQDPLQDISLTVTWSASSIEQTDTLKETLYDHMRTNADTVTTIDFSYTSKQDSTTGIYRLASTASDIYPVYFYRGAVTDNNVYFGGFCWQIVRTTSTGGVKLIYNGLNTGTSESPACNNTGNSSQLASNSKFNNSYNSPAYVGYMYGKVYEMNYTTSATGWKYAPDVTYSNGMYTLTSKTISGTTYNVEVKNNISRNNLIYHHYTCGNATDTSCVNVKYVFIVNNDTSQITYYITLTGGVKIEEALQEMLANSTNTTSSTIKTAVDTWYASNMTSYTNMLEDTPHCNDRSIYSLGGFNPEGGLVFYNESRIDTILQFTSRNRTLNTYTPIVTCNKNDAFTVNESAIGNGKLTYPIGLITSDEIMMAGGKNGETNSTFYLKGAIIWSLSPNGVYGSKYTEVWYIYSLGLLDYNPVDTPRGVRPTVSLKPGVRISSGTGLVSDPFIIE